LTEIIVIIRKYKRDQVEGKLGWNGEGFLVGGLRGGDCLFLKSSGAQSAGQRRKLPNDASNKKKKTPPNNQKNKKKTTQTRKLTSPRRFSRKTE